MGKYFLVLYLIVLVLVAAGPFGYLGGSLSSKTVFNLRGDYLAHVLVFLPLMPVCRMMWPERPLWFSVAAALLITGVVEGFHYVLPYRAYSGKDLAAGMAGVVIGSAYFLIKRMKEKI